MIQFIRGRICDTEAEALVNTVNCVGKMGKPTEDNVAGMVKHLFPQTAQMYQDAAQRGDIKVGQMFVTPNADGQGPKWIVHFPTKLHWRNPSQIEWIRDGLVDLVRVLREHGITSVAVPALGCNKGRLNWEDVKPLIEAALGDLPDATVTVYEPIIQVRMVTA
jgi:O-acetyl-ADP-ribose deacetylase (regulator of RNase III)